MKIEKIVIQMLYVQKVMIGETRLMEFRVSMGGGLCSASLINNTQNDRTPYILFAYHCESGAASGYVLNFNYQSSSCTGTSGSLNQSVSGSNLLVSEDINSGPDFALLELTSSIPDSYNPYYVGWSRSSLPPQEAVGIHHPGGDIKKISFTNDNVAAGGSGGIIGNSNMIMEE